MKLNGKLFKELRLNSRIKPGEAAKALGISRATLWRFEEEKGDMLVSNLQKYIDYLKLEVKLFIKDE